MITNYTETGPERKNKRAVLRRLKRHSKARFRKIQVTVANGHPYCQIKILMETFSLADEVKFSQQQPNTFIKYC